MDMKVQTPTEPLVVVGETIRKTVRYTREDIAHFARLTLDHNPLHHSEEAAQAGPFGQIIAAGQHTSAIMSGLVASHFSRCNDGLRREMLCLNFNFAYKHPVFADQDLHLEWRVSAVQPNTKLGGLLAHLDGSAAMHPDKPSVIARGTVLVKAQGTSSSL
jgi:acyl dehydratase